MGGWRRLKRTTHALLSVLLHNDDDAVSQPSPIATILAKCLFSAQKNTVKMMV